MPVDRLIIISVYTPTIDQIKEIDASSNEKVTPEKIIPLTTLKEITPVASLNKDSPSIIIFNLCGIGNFLHMTLMATGLVGEKIAPRSKASINGI